RWTVARNLACFLDLLAAGCVDLTDLIDTRLEFPRDENRYADLVSGKTKSLGAVFRYSRNEPTRSNSRPPAARKPRNGTLRVVLSGGGPFPRSTLLPDLAAIPSVSLAVICSGAPEQAAVLKNQYGFERCSSQAEEVLGAGDIDAVVIANRHSEHAA